MADETLFGWVHLSDIHFGHGGASYAPNQKLVLEEVQRDIAANKPRMTIDALIVTGDIAFSGNAVSSNEYARAREWLLGTAAAAGVEAQRVFLVPGNHDINRKVDDDPGIGPLVEMLRDGKRQIDADLANPKARRALAERMAAYLEFSTEFAPWARRSAVPPPEDRLTWVETIDARGGLKVRLVGLNTALLAKDRDEGKLRLGEGQLAATLEAAAPGEVVIALSHHPFRTGWLADEKNADRWLKSRAHVHLSGHVHEAETEWAGSGGGDSFVRVVAGAAHAERMPVDWIPASHGYSFGEIRRGAGDKLVVRVHPRLWSDNRKRFVLDVNGVPEGERHAEHPLPVTAPAGAPAASPAARAGTPLPKTGPVRVYISHAPGDAELCDKLLAHLRILQRRGVIESTSTRSVTAGGDWKGTVDARLAQAHVIVLLLSNDFLASEYCFDVEMEEARRRHEAGEVVVVPVVLRPTDLSPLTSEPPKDAPPPLWFERLVRVPRERRVPKDAPDRTGSSSDHIISRPDGIAVTTWPNLDEALMQVVLELRALVESARKAQA